MGPLLCAPPDMRQQRRRHRACEQPQQYSPGGRADDHHAARCCRFPKRGRHRIDGAGQHKRRRPECAYTAPRTPLAPCPERNEPHRHPDADPDGQHANCRYAKRYARVYAAQSSGQRITAPPPRCPGKQAGQQYDQQIDSKIVQKYQLGIDLLQPHQTLIFVMGILYSYCQLIYCRTAPRKKNNMANGAGLGSPYVRHICAKHLNHAENMRTSDAPTFTAGAKLATNIDCESMYHNVMQSAAMHPLLRCVATLNGGLPDMFPHSMRRNGNNSQWAMLPTCFLILCGEMMKLMSMSISSIGDRIDVASLRGKCLYCQ